MISKRVSSFKSHLTKEYLLTHRIDRNLSLRKLQVQEFLDNKRFRTQEKDSEMHVEADVKFKSEVSSSSTTYKIWENLQALSCDPRYIDNYASLIKSDDFQTKITGIICLRKLISKPVQPQIKEILSSKILLDLIQIARSTSDDRLLFEVIWIFVNIASSEYTHILIEYRIIDIIANLILRNNPYDLIDQLIWLIANIAADRNANCNEMRSRNFHEFLFKVFVDNISSKINRNCLWAMSNLLKGAKELNLTQNLSVSVSKCCQIISCFLNKKENIDFKKDRIDMVISNAISVISFITECRPCTLSILLKHKSAGDFLQLLDLVHQDESSFLSVLRVLGNFSANEQEYTEEIIKFNILQRLKEILAKDPPSIITKEICWILSNIAAGLEEHVDLFFTNKDMLAILFNILKRDDLEVKKEAIWCISNLTSTGNVIFINCLVNYGIIEVFSQWLSHTDYRLPALIMEALDNVIGKLIHHDSSSRLLYAQCDNYGIIQKLQVLSHSRNVLLRNKSEELNNKYFLYFREEEDLEMFDKEELYVCPNNNFTDDSEDMMPFINSVENKEEERNKENDPYFAYSNSMDDYNSVDFSKSN